MNSKKCKLLRKEAGWRYTTHDTEYRYLNNQYVKGVDGAVVRLPGTRCLVESCERGVYKTLKRAA